MQVLKFGGSSVANPANISLVIDIVRKAAERDRTIFVCSAIKGCTDQLIRIGKLAASRDESYVGLIEELRTRHHEIIRQTLPAEKHEEALDVCDSQLKELSDIAHGVFLLRELSATSLDAIQGCGELLITKILATSLSSTGIQTKWLDAREIINTSDLPATFSGVAAAIEANPITTLFVVPGFIASDGSGRMTTLGRGGSDYSASLFAVGCNARRLEIWTDVPGIMTANPALAPTARTVTNISYRAAQELSHFGAKVIYPPTIQPVVSEGIPIYVKNTFDPDAQGTLIEKHPPLQAGGDIIGISNSDEIALLSLEGSGMVGVPGFSSRLFETLSLNNINIILITQASSVHTMCIAVAEKDADRAKTAADECFAYEISLGKLNPLKVEKGYSIMCLVGDDILSRTGTTGRMLAALGRHGIPIRATAQGSSERNISVIVASSDADNAIKHIHAEFFDRQPGKIINLFIAGYGTVGRALVDIIDRRRTLIAERTGKILNVVGLSNSRKYTICKAGLDLSGIKALLDAGECAADDAYFEALANLSMENSIFVDCTGSSDISYKYVNLFRKGYSVIACNKISFSSPFSQYSLLKEAALECGVSLKYETTVGAALPILESISRSVNSGDEIKKIEAVLSGTLNYIFSTYKGGQDGVTFAQVVRQAQDAGYTEPDPRLDLSGRDVIRKLLILSREAGIAIDESDLNVTPLLGPEYFSVRIPEFYRMLAENEESFAAAHKASAEKGLRRRFVASLVKDENGYKASVGVREVGEGHPLYNLNGTDNCAIITTAFYPSPLIIQGAGAGAYQTASGVLNDILA